MKEFIRRPPAFQFYPSNVMSSIQYRTMSLSERGLMMSMQCECWVNDSVPSDAALLAKILSYTEEEVRNALTPNVMQFFFREEDKIICPELIAYRQKLDEAKRKQSEGGKEGQRRKKEKDVTPSYLEGSPEGSLVEHNLSENNLLKPITRESVIRKGRFTKENNPEKHQDFIDDMDNAESFF
jgi:uncharacterized protein YdaU (DUF1376 family)